MTFAHIFDIHGNDYRDIYLTNEVNKLLIPFTFPRVVNYHIPSVNWPRFIWLAAQSRIYIE